jgi:hypothetical protein
MDKSNNQVSSSRSLSALRMWEHNLTRGPEPELQPFDSESNELQWIIQRLKQIAADEETLASTCVMLRTIGLRDKYYKTFRDAGLDAVLLESRADNQKVPGGRVANMHRVKGLEFRHVILPINSGHSAKQLLPVHS